MHQREIERLIEIATKLADQDGRPFLVYLLQMVLLENRESPGAMDTRKLN
ncbi:UNVERIFIED_ORG: hypothetical protein LHK14_18935 [Roseateles sp. XES5]|nr:hypothetical protein [Roseateles sp. XES5]